MLYKGGASRRLAETRATQSEPLQEGVEGSLGHGTELSPPSPNR